MQYHLADESKLLPVLGFAKNEPIWLSAYIYWAVEDLWVLKLDMPQQNGAISLWQNQVAPIWRTAYLPKLELPWIAPMRPRPGGGVLTDMRVTIDPLL